MASRTIWHQEGKEDNLTPRTIWHHHKFYISTIVWPQNIIRNILIATIYLFDWKLSCIMSLYQIRARQGPHIKTYLISWQLFGPKISLEIHCWPITTFFKTVGENFSVSNCPILHDGVKLSAVSNCPRCQIVLLCICFNFVSGQKEICNKVCWFLS